MPAVQLATRPGGHAAPTLPRQLLSRTAARTTRSAGIATAIRMARSSTGTTGWWGDCSGEYGSGACAATLSRLTAITGALHGLPGRARQGRGNCSCNEPVTGSRCRDVHCKGRAAKVPPPGGPVSHESGPQGHPIGPGPSSLASPPTAVPALLVSLQTNTRAASRRFTRAPWPPRWCWTRPRRPSGARTPHRRTS